MDWGFNCGNRKKRCGMFVLRASSNSGSSDDGKRIGEIVVEGKRDKVVDFKNQVARLQATVASLPPAVFLVISLLISLLFRD